MYFFYISSSYAKIWGAKDVAPSVALLLYGQRSVTATWATRSPWSIWF